MLQPRWTVANEPHARLSPQYSDNHLWCCTAVTFCWPQDGNATADATQDIIYTLQQKSRELEAWKADQENWHYLAENAELHHQVAELDASGSKGCRSSGRTGIKALRMMLSCHLQMMVGPCREFLRLRSQRITSTQLTIMISSEDVSDANVESNLEEAYP